MAFPAAARALRFRACTHSQVHTQTHTRVLHWINSVFPATVFYAIRLFLARQSPRAALKNIRGMQQQRSERQG